MSNVPVSQRTESKLKVLVEARTLAIYTLQICTNKKVFLPRYDSVLADEIMKTAKDIFIDCYKANHIRVVGDDAKWKAQTRARLQRQALSNCESMFPLIEMAMKIYHLKASRIEYWTGKVLEVKGLIQKWLEKDVERYKNVI